MKHKLLILNDSSTHIKFTLVLYLHIFSNANLTLLKNESESSPILSNATILNTQTQTTHYRLPLILQALRISQQPTNSISKSAAATAPVAREGSRGPFKGTATITEHTTSTRSSVRDATADNS